ncbi:MAG TPA: M23 family metallopeptidase [Egibacteraceae bacterium]|nr:M23 family metallopeptidase [Egibacteraceae bacterium]
MSTDLRALGRLSESLGGGGNPTRRRRRVPVRRGPGPARRRPRLPRTMIAALAAGVVALAWLGFAASGSEEPAPSDGPASAVEPVPNRPAGEGSVRASRSESRVRPGATFAYGEELALALPHLEPVLVAFGEGTRAEALELRPVGRLLANDHHRYEPPRDVRGPDYVVLASEGKPRAATSAVDIVLQPEATVLAPVAGRVAQVREYAMEGGVRDYRVVIEAADRPSLHVVVVHLQRPAVAPGDVVAAAQTPLGLVRPLPFRRAVDAQLDSRLPHVHIEVKPAGEPGPPDPNEPAAAPALGAAQGR